MQVETKHEAPGDHGINMDNGISSMDNRNLSTVSGIWNAYLSLWSFLVHFVCLQKKNLESSEGASPLPLL